MILDANEAATDADVQADVAIIGAGTVGLLVAKVLSEAGKRVVVLEAGAETATSAGNTTSVSVVGKPHNGVSIGRASGLGGTSVLWGGQLAEFQEADLVRPGHEWPLSYAELARYYQDTYEALGLKAPEPTDVIQKSLGIETGADADVEQFFTLWLPQPNFALLFKPTIQSPDLKIILKATAYDFRLNEAGTVEAVRAITSSGKRFDIKADRFVVACGTIAAVQLFLSSSKLGRKPWSENAFIGAYFQDHVHARVASLSLNNEALFRRHFENAKVQGQKLQPKLRFAADAAEQFGSSTCGFFSFDSSISEQIANLKQVVRSVRSGVTYSTAVNTVRDALSVGRLFLPIITRYVRDRRIFAVFDKGIGFNIQAEQLPIKDSAIRLGTGGPGANNLHPVEVDWRVDGRELACIRAFVEAVDQHVQRLGIGRLEPDRAFMEDDQAAMNLLTDNYHQCGGLRMGRSASEGVTDGFGQVWGAKNLFVAGPTLMPTSSYANSTFTALALGVRLASRLT